MVTKTSNPSATVRMYRGFLGDCFLLKFFGAGRPSYVLIDCGILQGTSGASELTGRIMADIAKTTDNHLDVLVATHEHWDHISGFHDTSENFSKIRVDELWLGWTEDERDEQAMRLRAVRAKRQHALKQSFSALQELLAPPPPPKHDDDDDEPAGTALGPVATPMVGIEGLMAFAGVDPSFAVAGVTTGEILKCLKAKAGRVRYWSPGAPAFAMPGLPDSRVYVLGPPRDEILLRRSDPKKHSGEVYELGGGEDEAESFFASAIPDDASPSSDDLASLQFNLPFGPKPLFLTVKGTSKWLGRESKESGSLQWFQDNYVNQEKWRQIETDWFGAAEQLALKMDSDTNNTTLALAIELNAGGPVLLFPGDAQVGNWLSWGDYVWPPGARREDRNTVTIEDLLARTVLYKVGHHGSHNATLRERGLELMTHRDLVAMIPVDQEFANDKKHWNMPFPSLLGRIDAKTGGRVIRADRDRTHLVDASNQRAGKLGQLTQAEWDRFLDAVRDIKDADGLIAIEYDIC